MSSIHEIGGAAAPVWGRFCTAALRRLLSLSSDEATFAKRAFRATDPAKQAALEAIGESFILGYNAALNVDAADDVFPLVLSLPQSRRGFAAEGAAMGFAVADALPFRTPCLPAYLAAAERSYAYLVHVGVGWAMARLPWRRKALWSQLDPLLRWLAFDGMGFHDTYFNPRRVQSGWRRQHIGYAARAYDQGIGRALWFVSCGGVDDASRLVSRFAPERRGDLWSGLGLAMTYAGAVEASEVATAFSRAAEHRAQFVQGAAFACEARALASDIPAHTELVARALTGHDAMALALCVRDARPRARTDDHGPTPAYETWRSDVATQMVSLLEQRR
jgi:hypothetical protein